MTRTRQVEQAYTTYDDEVFTEHVTKYRKVPKTVKRIEFKTQPVEIDELQFDTETNVEKKSRWVPETRMVTRPVAAPTESCGCYKQDCGCVGQVGCGCCYPTCGCAPKAGLQTVSVSTVEHVEKPFEVTTVTKKPKVVTVKKHIRKPVVVEEEIMVEEPYVEEVTRTRRVPRVNYKSVPQEYTDWEFDNVSIQKEVDEEVKEIVNVPTSIMTEVDIEKPFEVIKNITEMVAEVQYIDRKIKTPITIVERLPEPPCHWHKVAHVHDIIEGQTHTHTEDHDHNDPEQSHEDGTTTHTILSGKM